MMQQPRAIISVPLSGRLRTMGVAAALVTLSLGICPVAAAADEALSTLITEASRRFDLPEPWLRSVIHAESGGNAQAVSPKGAIGLMQVMPDTFADLRTRYGLGADPFDPRDNILAGAAYLREMLDRFGAPGFLAAYNAGPARLADHLATGRALPAETQAYLARLVSMLGERTIPAKPVQPIRTALPPPASPMAPFLPHSAGLFVAAPGAGEWR